MRSRRKLRLDELVRWNSLSRVANILIVPDKFKGTLSAQAAAEAIAAGWRMVRPDDCLALLPMSDGGDGFGEIIAASIQARSQKLKTCDAAHRPAETTWWWQPKTRIAIIESARVIGLAMLPKGKYHPFELDTYGLGKAVLAAAKKGATHCYVGIGGSATNDAGFGMARALGWKFLDAKDSEITRWTALDTLKKIVPPAKRLGFKRLIVAVDVTNPLLGPKGCSRVYGPQKGLRPEDFPTADAALKQLALVARRTFGRDFARIPGAGAAGGLGFALMAFLGAKPESGFEIFADQTRLKKHLRQADLVITGEGALDAQTLMGKGVGQIALLCRKAKVPCIGIAGIVTEPEKARKLFLHTHALVDITTEAKAKKQPGRYLERVASLVAGRISTGW